MPEDDTTLRISREEKRILDTARNIWEEQNSSRTSTGGFVRLLAARYLAEAGKPPRLVKQSTGLIAAQEIKATEAEAVPLGPPIHLVTCCRCGGQIAWRLDLGPQGACPYCGALLRFNA